VSCTEITQSECIIKNVDYTRPQQIRRKYIAL
jgi:hypothetical protein